jgi:hypothetical protein
MSGGHLTAVAQRQPAASTSPSAERALLDQLRQLPQRTIERRRHRVRTLDLAVGDHREVWKRSVRRLRARHAARRLTAPTARGTNSWSRI